MFLEILVEPSAVRDQSCGPILSQRARRLPEAEASAPGPLLRSVVEEIALKECSHVLSILVSRKRQFFVVYLSSKDLFVHKENLGEDDEAKNCKEDDDQEEAEALALRTHLGDAGPPSQLEAALRGQPHAAIDRARSRTLFLAISRG